MSIKRPLEAAILLSCLLAAPTSAAEPTAWNWSGFYVGGHVGAFSGTTGFSDPEGAPLYGGFVGTSGFTAGIQLGYNWMLASQWLGGLEASGSYMSAEGRNTCLQATTTFIGSNCRVGPREMATLTGRLGFLTEPQGRTLVYGRGGLAYMRSEVSINPNNAFANLEGDPLSSPTVQGTPTSRSLHAWGWTVGAGVEHALSANWSVAFEYDYLRFNNLGMPTPQTVDVQTNRALDVVDPAFSNLVQDVHVLKVGLNYRWGGRQAAAATDSAARLAPREPWVPGWEFEVGGRYWYSSGKYQGANGGTDFLVSRLTYDSMTGHSGEVFARVDSPINFFAKGLVGGGFIASGRMHDEDWGISGEGQPAIGYEITQSSLSGSFNYVTADVGYNVLRGSDHKVGLFVGYNRYQTVMSAMGCTQLVNPASGICAASGALVPFDVNGVSEIDTWHSLRVGTAVEVQLSDRLRIAGDFAYLPYVWLDGLDIHHLRQPTVFFPAQGTGHGVQAEVVLSWQASERLSVGLGARYWGMWTLTAAQSDMATNLFQINNERYGVFLQAAYRWFKSPG